MKFKLPDNLPNQSKPEKENDYNAKGVQLAKANVYMRDAYKAAWQKYKNANPNIDENIKFNFLGHAYVKTANLAPVRKALILRMFYSNHATSNMTDILNEVREEFPNVKGGIPDNIWNRKLNSSQLRKCQEIVTCSSAKPISIKTCKTLSEIRKIIKAHWIAGKADFTIKVNISIDQHNMIIGKKTYPIIKRNSRGHTYSSVKIDMENKYQWLRVDVLRAAFSTQ